MTKNIVILGSTGSIGRQTVSIAQRLGINVLAITGGKNAALLEQQARLLRPKMVCISDESAAAGLKASLADTDIRVLSGEKSLVDAATIDGADCVVTAVSGSVGLKPTLAAISLSRRIALANKETLVCAGEIVMEAAEKFGAEIIPVDSEHSAIFQCLEGREKGELSKIILTASGGPFRGMKLSETYGKTPAEALKHPNWSMGAKISIDSATMMNKGLELIEAMHLFSVSHDKIDIHIHPQSIVHSAVELLDGTVIAQLGVPDMALPIQYALSYPQRCASETAAPNFFELGALTFEKPSLSDLPCLALAIDCAERGGIAPCVMSAANEAAVELFLQGKIFFGKIFECVSFALDSISIKSGYSQIGENGEMTRPTLEDLLEADAEARALVKGNF